MQLRGDKRTVLEAIWKRVGKQRGAATVTRRQLCEDATVKRVLVRTKDHPTWLLKNKGYLTLKDGQFALTPEGRKLCIASFGRS